VSHSGRSVPIVRSAQSVENSPFVVVSTKTMLLTLPHNPFVETNADPEVNFLKLLARNSSINRNVHGLAWWLLSGISLPWVAFNSAFRRLLSPTLVSLCIVFNVFSSLLAPDFTAIGWVFVFVWFFLFFVLFVLFVFFFFFFFFFWCFCLSLIFVFWFLFCFFYFLFVFYIVYLLHQHSSGKTLVYTL